MAGAGPGVINAGKLAFVDAGDVIVAMFCPWLVGFTRSPGNDKLPIPLERNVMYLFPVGNGNTMGPANTAPAGKIISCSTELLSAAKFMAFCRFTPLAAALAVSVRI